MDKEQLQGQIRFALEQLSAKNEQMRFERMCMHLARLRIAINVVPATGPVQAGGDQGRDFETFHSYLRDSPLAEHLLVGRISDGCLAFACSTEQDPVRSGKILRDVKTILASGVAVTRIYFFSSRDIPVGDRHKVQEKARKQLKVEVEVWDGQAISLHLTDPDAFWIAVSFLNIPAEAFPSQDLNAPWYSELKEKYAHEQTSLTYEEFADLKMASRFIYKDEERKVDLPFWMARLAEFAGNEEISFDLRRAAIYEMFVARMVGMHDVTGTEDYLRYYFADFGGLSVSEFKDAGVLLSFSLGAAQLFGLQIGRDELLAWADAFKKMLEEELRTVKDPSVRCSILEALANYELTIIPIDGDFNTAIAAYINGLEKLLPILPKAVFFPVAYLAYDVTNFVDKFLGMGLPVDRLDAVAEKVDSVLAQQSGRVAKASALRNRALVHYKHGRHIQALEILQRISRDWFTEDSMKEFILSMLVIADCYSKLHLHHASKSYALSIAFLIHKRNLREHMTYLARSLATAARADYNTGSWMHYFELATVSLVTHHLIVKDFNPYEEEKEVIYSPMLILYFARRYNLGIHDLLERQMENWGYVKADVLEFSAKLKSNLDALSVSEIERMLGQLDGSPFNDVGAQRELAFSASGLSFRVRCVNGYDNNCLLEHVVAALQILLADLSAFDLLLIPSEIELYVEYRAGEKTTIHEPTISAPRAWKVSGEFQEVPKRSTVGDATMELVAALCAMLRSYSVLKDEEFHKIIRRVIQKGDIVGKVFPGVHYHDMYRSFYARTVFESQTRHALMNTMPKQSCAVAINETLPWRSGIASQYNAEEALKNIEGRLSMKKVTRLTLPILLASAEFKSNVQALRDEGWLDWHIYLALINTIMNYKMHRMDLNKDARRMMEYGDKYYKMEEEEWYIEIPLEAVSKDNLKRFLELMMPTTLLTNYGLENHATYSDPSGMLELLKHRFRLFEDGKDLTFT